MKINLSGLAFAVGFLAALLIAGCEKEQPAPQAPPEVKRAQPAPSEKTAPPRPAAPAPAPPQAPKPKAAPSDQPSDAARPAEREKAAPSTSDAEMHGNQLTLAGIVMTVPAGWEKVDVSGGGPMSPKAIFRIPAESGDGAIIRITHFPEMHGKQLDDMNINRWVSQVTKADGTPITREEAKIETKENGEVHLTLFDASGTVKATMRENAQPESRLIAAIVDHPKGPHFVVASGKAALMDKAAADVRAFIESAKIAP